MVCIFFFIYGMYVASDIDQRYASLRWQSASRISSDVMTLEPGLCITKKEVLERLGALGYRSAGKISRPGEYRLSGGNLYVWLKAQDDGLQGFPVLLTWKSGCMSTIGNLKERQHLARLDLAPQHLSAVMGSSGELRTLVSLDRMPRQLCLAILAAEDSRFYQHHGLDISGLARAMWSNFRSKSLREGGSTITQQLVKNYFLSPERTFRRKLEEAVISLVTEWRFKKNEILEMYLNEIYLGQDGPAAIHGVGEAARYYFKKDCQDLSLAESALLAGMVKGPNLYSPFKNLALAKKQRDRVLQRMLQMRWISPEEYMRAEQTPIVVHRESSRAHLAPYFLDLVTRQLREEFSDKVLRESGLRVRTTLDTHLQHLAEEALRKGLARVEKQIRPRGDAPYKPLQGVLIAMDPQSGVVKALVGGREDVRGGFNRAVQARRQPGSAFKPFVFQAALDKYTLSSFIADTPVVVDLHPGRWEPVNYDRRYKGRITLRTALEESRNAATVRLGLAVGIDRVIQTTKADGIKSGLKKVPALLIGGVEVTPLELAVAYCSFANGGFRVVPSTLASVSGPHGKKITLQIPQKVQVMSAQKAFLMTSLLKGVALHGTARRLSKLGVDFPVACKTGTTNDYRDAWLVGYTPDLLTLVWVGYDDGRSLGRAASSIALPIWADFMMQANRGRPKKDFTQPEGIAKASVCHTTGMLANTYCPDVQEEVYIAGTEPKERCDKHGLKQTVIDKIKSLLEQLRK
ncbi:MAG: PBP1A family penicillin-binding protein [Thermodesulfobacteriota bacterium]